MTIEFDKDGMLLLIWVLVAFVGFCAAKVIYKPSKGWEFWAAFGGAFSLAVIAAYVKYTTL